MGGWDSRHQKQATPELKGPGVYLKFIVWYLLGLLAEVHALFALLMDFFFFFLHFVD